VTLLGSRGGSAPGGPGFLTASSRTAKTALSRSAISKGEKRSPSPFGRGEIELEGYFNTRRSLLVSRLPACSLRLLLAALREPWATPPLLLLELVVGAAGPFFWPC
jgi:hypothetical protein